MTPHLTTTANSLFCLWEAYRVSFLFSLSVFFLFMLPLVSYVEGTSLYTSLRYQADADAQLSLFCVVFKNQLVAD